MNQFIIENPVLCIVIAFIICAVIMNITSALTVRMAVEKRRNSLEIEAPQLLN